MQYYSEIESDFFLPVNVQKRMNHELNNSKVPLWFYEKYQNLIGLIPIIKEMFVNFSLDKYFNNKNYSQINKDKLKWLLRTYKTKCLHVNSNLNEKLTLLEMKTSIQCWGNILDLMFTIDNTLFESDYFIGIMQLYNSALIDIGSIDGSLAKSYLSNKWLLTSKGYLYNMQATAHEGGFYDKYYAEKINCFLSRKESYICDKNDATSKKIDLKSSYNTSTILKRGYIEWHVLDSLLHEIDYYHFNKKIYDSKIIMVATGILELRQDLLGFLEKLELYTKSPKDSLRKIIEITNDKYLDVLIRCCGVSKITSSPYKTIITSSLTAKTDFKEYLERGYNVCFIPPIIINRETKMVEELNMNSYIVSEYIKNEVICDNELNRGKVYTNHMEF